MTATNITDTQMNARRDQLRKLMAHHGMEVTSDYGWEELLEVVGHINDPSENESPDDPLSDCPRYALTLSDETYTTFQLLDTVQEALHAAADAPSGGTLNSPGDLFDLDSEVKHVRQKWSGTIPYKLVAVLVEN